MRRTSLHSFLYLFIVFMALVSLPMSVTRALKSRAVASCAPVWSLLRRWQTAGFGFQSAYVSSTFEYQEKLARLEKENCLLREQCTTLQNILASDEHLAREEAWLKELQGRESVDPQWKEFFKRRACHLTHRLQYHLQSLPAKVVFREPRHWESVLWLDVGEEDNERTGARVVAHNSPVVVGNVLIGVVEHVERKRSEVRLITDTHLVPSVRAVRGEQSHRSLLLLMDHLITILQKRSGMYSSTQEENKVLSSLADFRRSLQRGWGDYYLAKGELYGSSAPLWRAKRPVLYGVGFNYDTADEEGGARDLRSGELVENREKGLPLLQPGDLLVTSGLDGIFPQGLEVGIVAKVNLLREGDCTYDLEAVPVIENLAEIEYVTILPPLENNTISRK